MINVPPAGLLHHLPPAGREGGAAPGVDKATGVQPTHCLVHLLVEKRVLGHIDAGILHVHRLPDHMVGVGMAGGVQEGQGHVLVGHGEYLAVPVPLQGLQHGPVGGRVQGPDAIGAAGQLRHLDEQALRVRRADALEALRQQLFQREGRRAVQLQADEVEQQRLVGDPQRDAGPQPVGGDEAVPPGARQPGQSGAQQEAHDL